MSGILRRIRFLTHLLPRAWTSCPDSILPSAAVAPPAVNAFVGQQAQAQPPLHHQQQQQHSNSRSGASACRSRRGCLQPQ